MNESLGREVKVGDLVVVKGTGRYNAGLRIGVFTGKSVRFKTGTSAKYNQCYLIENPNKEEQAIRAKILENVDLERLSAPEKPKDKTLKFDELVDGTVYRNKRNHYLYLKAERTVRILDKKESYYSDEYFGQIKDGEMESLYRKFPKLTMESEVQCSEEEIEELLKGYIQHVRMKYEKSGYDQYWTIPLRYKHLL